ncbi:MFS transporter [Neobacillus sp. DY30]|uniref:MFS transporter n=1 Tax=Neobacillus sp. DY30 TaxID=3047871 RepID=UPI0024BF1DE9|nr:MFS transporter [Neobacillus sp. DY30]WHY00080.1 MFS transporter [Neobacillus sp. DY30]
MNNSLMLKKATYHLWTFTISKLISSFGSQVYSFAISFYILQATGSAKSFALNLICNVLPRTLAAPFAGYIIDKYPRKRIAIISQIATTLAIGGLLFVSVTSGLSLTAIYITTCLLSLTSMFSSVAFTSSITGLVDEARIQKAMSLNQMSISFAAIASPAVGGLLYGVISMPLFLILYLAASTVAIVLEATMNFTLFSGPKENNMKKTQETMWQGMKAGVSYLKLQPLLMTIIWIALLVNFLFSAYQVGYSFILIEKLKMLSHHFGLTEGAFAVGMLLLSIYLSIRREIRFPLLVSKGGIIIMGIIMGGATLPLLFSLPYNVMFGYYIILQLGLGACIVFVNTPTQVMMQKQIADEFKGRVFSLVETVAMALMPLGMVLYGFLYDVFPAQWVLLLSSGIFLGVVLTLLRPAVIRKVHPELAAEENRVKNKAEAF